MDTVITTRRMSLGPLPALLAAAALLTGCVSVPAGSPAPRPNQAVTTASPVPAPDVQPAGGSDVLVRIESDHPERAERARSPPVVPAARRCPPASRGRAGSSTQAAPPPAAAASPGTGPATGRTAPHPWPRPADAGAVPECRRSVSGAVSQLCRQAYGR
ncbi:hypothetical protein LUR56_06105 [Streptomyces sp. MT29]|nr:hypothetical protein [Streptomyces sp. MT29]